MNAKKCDRCGKYYEGKETAAVTLTNGENNFTRALLRCDLNPKEKSYDLCNDCADSFGKWMDNSEVEEHERNSVHDI